MNRLIVPFPVCVYVNSDECTAVALTLISRSIYTYHIISYRYCLATCPTHPAKMAAFDDPSWFEDSILNFDPNHLAPLPPQMLDYNNNSSGSGSGESNRSRNSLSPMSMSGPPSLHHTATTSESSPRSYGTGSPASTSFLNTSFSESELDDLLNYGAGGGGGITGMDDYTQQGQGQNPLFLPPAMFGGFDFTKMMAAAGGQQDPFGNLNTGMFFQPPQQQQQQQLQQPQQQQQTMAPQWMQTQTHQVQPVTVKQEQQQQQPETRTSVLAPRSSRHSY